MLRMFIYGDIQTIKEVYKRYGKKANIYIEDATTIKAVANEKIKNNNYDIYIYEAKIYIKNEGDYYIIDKYMYDDTYEFIDYYINDQISEYIEKEKTRARIYQSIARSLIHRNIYPNLKWFHCMKYLIYRRLIHDTNMYNHTVRRFCLKRWQLNKKLERLVVRYNKDMTIEEFVEEVALEIGEIECL